jgi:hypothetical protein
MKICFKIWGGIGLFYNTLNLWDVLAYPQHVGGMTYLTAVVLIWIGGMLFFGLGALMPKSAPTPAVESPAEVTPPVAKDIFGTPIVITPV